jgi:S1-C subfamily serine protease
MLLLRALVTGLIAACVVLAAMAQPPVLATVPTSAPAPEATTTPVSIVDVAGGVPANELAALAHLRPGEAVTAVGEQAIGTDLAAGAVIASLPARPGSYIDLTLAGPNGERRVLLLLH